MTVVKSFIAVTFDTFKSYKLKITNFKNFIINISLPKKTIKCQKMTQNLAQK